MNFSTYYSEWLPYSHTSRCFLAGWFLLEKIFRNSVWFKHSLPRTILCPSPYCFKCRTLTYCRTSIFHISVPFHLNQHLPHCMFSTWTSTCNSNHCDINIPLLEDRESSSELSSWSIEDWTLVWLLPIWFVPFTSFPWRGGGAVGSRSTRSDFILFHKGRKHLKQVFIHGFPHRLATYYTINKRYRVNYY
jgi:hypothetical protein